MRLVAYSPRRFVAWLPLCVLTGVLLLPRVVLAGQIDPDDPPQGLFSDEWMALCVSGQKAGYAQASMSLAGDEVTTRVVTHFSVGRAGAAVEISSMESSTETVTGVPLSFESSQKLAAMTTVIRGRIRNGEVAIEKSQYNMVQKDRVAYPVGALMAWGLYREEVRRGMTEGLSYDLDVYVPSLRTDQAIKSAVTIGGRETIDLLGISAEGTRMTTTMSSPMGTITAVSWVDDDWAVLKTEIAMMGMPFAMVRTDKQSATENVSAPELFMTTLVNVDRTIDRGAARRLRYRLYVAGEGDPVPDLPATGMQRATRRADGSVELEVTRQDHEALKKAGATPAGDEPAEYLESNLWINSDDPEVMAMAREAAGKAGTPYEIADRLRAYVTRVIKDKNLSIGFASASEVCRNREGDCSEHAVLLAALGRVHRIPTRVVMGLVYVPAFTGASDVFGFHMWAQFHLGGQWVDFDAAQRESDCNPTHLVVATSSLKDAALGDMAFALINIIGRLGIEVLEADPPSAVGQP